MSYAQQTQKQFEALCQLCFSQLSDDEEAAFNLASEKSAFIRFNGGKVRQATDVDIKDVNFDFQSQGVAFSMGFPMTGHFEEDSKKVLSLLERARHEVKVLPKDPFLVPMENRGTSEQIFEGYYPKTPDLVESIGKNLKGTDFAGLLSVGTMIRANANSKGQKHWFSTEPFCFDYSIYVVNSEKQNKAVKGVYTGLKWDEKQWAANAAHSRSQLEPLKKTNHQLKPGDYRVYLSPSAVFEISGLLYWSMSFSSFKQGKSALQKVANKEASFSPLFSLRENFDLGFAPGFNSVGEVSAPQVPLIENGQLEQFLISLRSAKEHGAKGNAADPSENARTLEILPGSLEESDILKTLGTGIYINNLHYINWSDLASARLTGMTRYACFWVEDGKIQAPIYDMRFDESLYRIFGSELEALTKHSEANIFSENYSVRSVGGYKMPGAIVKNFRFTL